ncbi:MAG: hypothetical protein WD852_05905 [Methyloceanibacter sp.]
MTAQLPLCVQYLQAFSTPIIALMVAVIAYRQWRTAHQNLLSQLFDKRMAVITELRGIVAELLQDGKFDNGASLKFLRATTGADFLFGSEVKAYLDRIYTVLLDLHVCDVELEHAEGQERVVLVQKRRPLFDELSGFFKKFSELVAAYVKMDQKQSWF